MITTRTNERANARRRTIQEDSMLFRTQAMIQYDWFSFDCNYLPRSFVVHFFFVADVHGCASARGESNMYSFDRRFDYAAFLELRSIPKT